MFLSTIVGLLAGLMSPNPASAETALKFSLDFIMFGPNSPFVYADEHGYFKKPGSPCRFNPPSGRVMVSNGRQSARLTIGMPDVANLIESAAKKPVPSPTFV